jgi:hypothetical protein
MSLNKCEHARTKAKQAWPGNRDQHERTNRQEPAHPSRHKWTVGQVRTSMNMQTNKPKPAQTKAKWVWLGSRNQHNQGGTNERWERQSEHMHRGPQEQSGGGNSGWGCLPLLLVLLFYFFILFYFVPSYLLCISYIMYMLYFTAVCNTEGVKPKIPTFG